MRMAAVRAEPPLARHCPTAQARRRGEIAPGRLRLVPRDRRFCLVPDPLDLAASALLLAEDGDGRARVIMRAHYV